ncbi:MAG: hypothetical protein EAX87_14390 [Candidatus Thorarchaeota archaeon]|nr:hypothetical protein [Candidatus Thorarchaeota archaeon]
MRVEVDISDLDELDYYIDEKSEELEKALRDEPKFAGYIVKRQHWGGDGEFDTFVIQDLDGKDLVALDNWEVETLSASELLLYADVQIGREQHDYAGSDFFFVIIVCLFGPAAVFFSIFSLISPVNPVSLIGTVVSILMIAIFGLRFFRIRQEVLFNKHQIDLIAARENSTFLSALRKLASLSNIEDWKHGEYRRRLKSVEDSLAEIKA